MITAIAVGGISVGVAALIVAQALITGFRSDVQSKILRGTYHLNLIKEDNSGIEDYRDLAGRIGKMPGVRAVSAAIYTPVLLNFGDRQEQAVLKGVDPIATKDAGQDVGELSASVIEGDASKLHDKPDNADEPPIIPGRQLAQSLGVKIGDRVSAITAQSRLTPAGLQSRPQYTRFKVVGIFSSGLYEYDSKWAYISLPAAQKLSGSGDTAGVIQMNVDDIYAVGKIGERVRAAAGAGFMTTNWQELNRPLFAALQLQHRLVVVFFALLIVIAALNIVTTLTMMVIEKHRDIGILRAQGATPNAIRKIFILQGAVIGAIGAVLGLALGLLVSWAANVYRLISIPEEIYSVSHIALKVRPFDCLWVMLLAMAVCIVATLYPSRAASRLAPVEALK